jgi:hypothetical protein
MRDELSYNAVNVADNPAILVQSAFAAMDNSPRASRLISMMSRSRYLRSIE